MRKLLAVIAAGGVLALTGPAIALAADPHTSGQTGQPGQDCTSSQLATSRPGNSASSSGSVFNEQGINSTNGGTGGNAYNNAGAPSQYDVACFQQFSKP
jgi:hypothetical protein